MVSSIPRKFNYYSPATVEEASGILAKYEGAAKILAGGHSLIPAMKLRITTPDALVDLRRVEGLKSVQVSGSEILVGPMVTYREIERSEVILKYAPLLAETASSVADIQVRNRGTVGGAVAHLDQAGDVTAALLALDASFEVKNVTSRRVIHVEDMFVDFLTTALKPDEVLSNIAIPIARSNAGSVGYAYVKLPNKASHYAIVGVAVILNIASDGTCLSARIAVTGVGAYPKRVKQTEDALINKPLSPTTVAAAAEMACNEYNDQFNEDVHASSQYRQAMTKVFTKRAIYKSAERAGVSL